MSNIAEISAMPAQSKNTDTSADGLLLKLLPPTIAKLAKARPMLPPMSRNACIMDKTSPEISGGVAN